MENNLWKHGREYQQRDVNSVLKRRMRLWFHLKQVLSVGRKCASECGSDPKMRKMVRVLTVVKHVFQAMFGRPAAVVGKDNGNSTWTG